MVRIWSERTVIRCVWHPVIVIIGVAQIAHTVAVKVSLVRVENCRTVVASITDAVTVRIGLPRVRIPAIVTDITDAVAVSIRLRAERGLGIERHTGQQRDAGTVNIHHVDPTGSRYAVRDPGSIPAKHRIDFELRCICKTGLICPVRVYGIDLIVTVSMGHENDLADVMTV